MQIEYILILISLVLLTVFVIFYFLSKRKIKKLESKLSHSIYLDIFRDFEESELTKYKEKIELDYELEDFEYLLQSFNNTDSAFKELLDEIKEIFNVEYVSIGILSTYSIEDIGYSLDSDNEISKAVIKKINRLSNTNSFVSNKLSLISPKDSFIHFFSKDENLNERYIEENNGSLEIYKEYINNVLPSKKMGNIAIKGIYKEDILYGYILMLNQYDGSFSDNYKRNISIVSDKLSEVVNNYVISKNRRLDDDEVLKWYKITSTNELIDKVLEYLNTQLNIQYSTYKILFKNGFSEKKNKYYITNFSINSNLEKHEFDKISKFINEKRLSDLNKDLVEELNNYQKIDQTNKFFFDNSNLSQTISTFSTCIPTLIMNNSVESYFELNYNNNTNHDPFFILRINNIIDHFRVLLEKKTYQTTYEQIKGLSQFYSSNNEDSYFENLVEFIKKSIKAQSCSIFLKEEDGGSLFLRATTAKEIKNKISGDVYDVNDIKEMIRVEKPIYSLVNHKSITSKIHIEKRDVIIYNVYDIEETNYSFMEKTKDSHKSLLAISIIGSSNEPIGVIRCINKDSISGKEIFTQTDLHALHLYTRIISNQIELSEFVKYRNKVNIEFSHETRTPLDAAKYSIGILELSIRQELKKAKLPYHLLNRFDSLKSNLSLIHSNIENVSKFISYNNKTRPELFISKVDIIQLLKNNIEIFKINRSIYLNVDLDEEELKIFINKSSINQVFYNLISNAVRYGEKSSTIKIIISTGDQNYIRIDFSNFGIGIDSGMENKIFELGYRSEKAKEITNEGSGIGLYVTKKQIKKHDGKILVSKNSDPTVFTLLLPKYLEKRKPYSNE